MPDARRLPNKKDVARALLLKGSLFVHLDPRAEGVVVPPWLKNQPQLVLQVGLDLAVPIPDLRVDDGGVYGTLSFSRQPFTCVVPWDAVFAAVGDDGRGMVWPDSMPKEIAAEVEREARRNGHGAIAELHAAETRGDDEASGELEDLDGAETIETIELDGERRWPAETPSLKVIDGDGQGGSRGGEASDAERGDRKRDSRPPWLRVVK
ncbi:MAG: ClpXP protease specificity-enhancing factor SspB [Myxococcales bacterium]|jgi:hypothetical protein